MQNQITPKVLLIDENKGFGGAERHLITLAEELHHDQILGSLVARRSSWLGKNCGDLPFTAVGFRNEVDMMSVFSIYRTIKNTGCNVLHCIGHRDLVASALARQLPGVPKTVLLKAEHSYPDKSLSPLFRWGYAQCNAVTSVSEPLQAEANKAIGCKAHVETSVIANGIPVQTALEPCRPTADRQLQIGVLSPLRPGKGQEDVLNALAALDQSTLDRLRVSFAGEGENRESLEQQAAQLGLKIQFAGHVEEPERFLQSLDLSIVPSHKETFSLVTLETMFCGRPLIAADSDGVKSLTDDFPALLYPVGKVKELSQAVTAFCEDPESHQRKAFEAAPSIREKYSSRRMAARYTEIYQRLLEKVL